jgi:hypothetical protein
MATTDVYIETGKTRVVVCAWDWPGWCRYGTTPELAVQALLDAAPRYAIIAGRAGLAFDSDPELAITQLPGTANTDWAPSLITERDTEPQSAAKAAREVALLRAAWEVFDEVVATSSPTLRKGPRGGGRDLDAVAQHVQEAERAYARKIGVKHPPLEYMDSAARQAFRSQVASVLSSASDGAISKWPAAYAIRRFAWHVIDHTWEIQDKQT